MIRIVLDVVQIGIFSLALFLCLNLVFIFTAIPSADAKSEIPINKIDLYATYTNLNKYSTSYTWDAVGRVYGSVSGFITWHETGYLSSSGVWLAKTSGTITTDNGKVYSYQLGTSSKPYVWQGWQTGGEIWSAPMIGPFYLDGVYYGIFQGYGYGTLFHWVIPLWPFDVFTPVKCSVRKFTLISFLGVHFRKILSSIIRLATYSLSLTMSGTVSYWNVRLGLSRSPPLRFMMMIQSSFRRILSKQTALWAALHQNIASKSV